MTNGPITIPQSTSTGFTQINPFRDAEGNFVVPLEAHPSGGTEPQSGGSLPPGSSQIASKVAEKTGLDNIINAGINKIGESLGFETLVGGGASGAGGVSGASGAATAASKAASQANALTAAGTFKPAVPGAAASTAPAVTTAVGAAPAGTIGSMAPTTLTQGLSTIALPLAGFLAAGMLMSSMDKGKSRSIDIGDKTREGLASVSGLQLNSKFGNREPINFMADGKPVSLSLGGGGPTGLNTDLLRANLNKPDGSGPKDMFYDVQNHALILDNGDGTFQQFDELNSIQRFQKMFPDRDVNVGNMKDLNMQLTGNKNSLWTTGTAQGVWVDPTETTNAKEVINASGDTVGSPSSFNEFVSGGRGLQEPLVAPRGPDVRPSFADVVNKFRQQQKQGAV